MAVMKNLVVGEYYHLYNRGADKRDIFTSNYERKRFVLLMYLCNQNTPLDMRALMRDHGNKSYAAYFSEERAEPLVSIGAYCLMPNHFHILAKEITEGGITSYIRRICTAYSSFFNGTHDRSGTLFQGKFQAKRVDSDPYFRYLYSYIHLNPVKLIDPRWKENGIRDRKQARAHLEKYEFSSFFDYRGDTRPQAAILDRGSFPDYFESRSEFESHVEDFLNYQGVL